MKKEAKKTAPESFRGGLFEVSPLPRPKTHILPNREGLDSLSLCRNLLSRRRGTNLVTRVDDARVFEPRSVPLKPCHPFKRIELRPTLLSRQVRDSALFGGRYGSRVVAFRSLSNDPKRGDSSIYAKKRKGIAKEFVPSSGAGGSS